MSGKSFVYQDALSCWRVYQYLPTMSGKSVLVNDIIRAMGSSGDGSNQPTQASDRANAEDVFRQVIKGGKGKTHRCFGDRQGSHNRHSERERFLRRGLPYRTAAPFVLRNRNDRLLRDEN